VTNSDKGDVGGAGYTPEQVVEIVKTALSRGLMAVEQGDAAGGEQIFRGILEIDPRNAEALNGLGVISSSKGDMNAAERYLRQAVEIDSQNSQYHRNLGFVYAGRGRLKRALRSLAEVVRLDPEDTEARYRLAWVHQGRGEIADFETALRELLDIDAGHAEANNDLGCLLAQQGRLDDAAPFLRHSVETEPGNAAFRSNLANTLMMTGDVVRARDEFAAAVENDPGHVEALKGLAMAERVLGNLDEAMKAAEMALALAPGDAGVENLVGTVCKELGNYDDALAHFQKACELVDGFAPARSNIAMIELLRGAWKTGFSAYEARRFDSNVVSPRAGHTYPQWDGSALTGRSILLQTEQGFGDTIQFCRFARQLAKDGARVVLEAQEPLQALLRTLGDDIEVIAPGAEAGDIDVVAPLMSLPHLIGIASEDDVSGEAYLHAGEMAADVATVLAEASGIKVGINWRGAPSHKEDWKRSVDPGVLTPILEVAGAEFFSLYVGGTEDLPAGVTDLAPHIGDFADTAAIMTGLDLIISVDTATVHLAGALGRKCWVMLPCVPDWRWMLDRDDAPWYDSLTLYRQPARGDWDTVVSKIRHDLQLLCGS